VVCSGGQWCVSFILRFILRFFFVFTVPHGERKRTCEVRSRSRSTVWNGLKAFDVDVVCTFAKSVQRSKVRSYISFLYISIDLSKSW